ncbi:MAG: response regulator [Desulfuromonadales bacterium]|nr:response regulator [Desulfuromonadales bacterium]
MDDRILIIDDEIHVLRALQRALQNEGYEIVTTTSAEEALTLLRRYKFKVVITDERMPGMFGSELLATITVRQPEVVKMLLTGYASVEAAIRAVNEGEVYRFLTKPWDDFELKLAIRAGIENYDLKMKNRKLQALVRTQYYKLTGRLMAGTESEMEQLIEVLSEAEIATMIKECGLEV